MPHGSRSSIDEPIDVWASGVVLFCLRGGKGYKPPTGGRRPSLSREYLRPIGAFFSLGIGSFGGILGH